MDASRRTAHGNAYFIGFGRSKRIVLFDTLVDKSPEDEIEAVIAHELGHFKHKHILFGLARSALITLAVLAAFGWLAKQPWLAACLRRLRARRCGGAVRVHAAGLGRRSADGARSRIGFSRRNEYQADDFARRAVGAGPMVGALTRLARDNASTLTPDPLYALVHHSHPSVPLRVRHLRAMETVGV